MWTGHGGRLDAATLAGRTRRNHPDARGLTAAELGQQQNPVPLQSLRGNKTMMWPTAAGWR